MQQLTRLAFQSPIPYSALPPSTAVVYCSDGRLGEHIDAFVKNRLGIAHFDRLAIPGGAAGLGTSWASWYEGEALGAQLRFLMDAHVLQRIVLIAHEDCAHYTQRLGLRGPAMSLQQRDDLLQASRRIRQLGGRPQVEAYVARPHNGRISFDRLPL